MTQGLSGYATSNPGSSTNVQSGAVQQQTGLASLFGGTAVADPNAAAYNAQMAAANQNAQQLNGQGMGGFTQQTAQIANPYQAASQNNLAGTQAQLGNVGQNLQNTMNGQGPAVTAAQNQMTQATGQNIAAQMAMARSANGGALAQNAAQMGAQGNIAGTLGNAASQSAQNLAQQELQAAQAAGQLYGTQGNLQLGQYNLEQQNAQQQAQLQAQNQAQQNQMQLGLLGAGAQQQGLAQNSMNSYNSALLGAEQLNNTENQQGFSNAMGVASKAAGLLKGGGVGLASVV
jgi:hypothetical protein